MAEWKPISSAPVNVKILVRDESGSVRIAEKVVPEDHTTRGTFYGEPRWTGDRDDWEPKEWQELPNG